MIACNGRQQKTSISDNSTASEATIIDQKHQNKREVCWIGTLNDTIPVFIHYQADGNVIVGEITYLKTNDKLPVRLLGNIEEDKRYRLLEFDKTGNITGVIEGKQSERAFYGSWVSPRTKRELQMRLLLRDTLITSPSIKPEPSQIFGNYHYQYGEKGYNGDFELSKAGDGKAAFHILSLTNVERGPNVAEVEKDTITLVGDGFVYRIPDSDNCEFKVSFFKDFVYINYTKGYCQNQFGLNATITGIYLKTK